MEPRDKVKLAIGMALLASVTVLALARVADMSHVMYVVALLCPSPLGLFGSMLVGRGGKASVPPPPLPPDVVPVVVDDA